MTKSLKIAALAGAAMFALSALPTAALADGVIIIDKEAAVQGSSAFQTAIGQIKVTYAATISQGDARGKALDAALQPQVAAFKALQAQGNASQAVLQAKYNAIQQQQQAGQAELQKIYAPVQRAEAYSAAQIDTHLETALKAVMTKRGANVVLVPQATVSYQPAADATQDLISELNVEVPTVNTAVPAGWQPGQPVPGSAPATSGGR